MPGPLPHRNEERAQLVDRPEIMWGDLLDGEKHVPEHSEQRAGLSIGGCGRLAHLQVAPAPVLVISISLLWVQLDHMPHAAAPSGRVQCCFLIHRPFPALHPPSHTLFAPTLD